jgi:acyl-CoA reductase-like NAD-dependent aldehyde dehydrogenase
MSVLEAARQAGERWARLPLRQRLAVVRRFRHQIAERIDELVATVPDVRRASPAETVSAEVLPLADACRFLEREAPALLRPRRPGGNGRPAWHRGTRLTVRREPLGVVLVLAPSNYPLLLPGVHALQALVAGNAVVLKPGRGGSAAALALYDLLGECGLPQHLLQVLDENPAAVEGLLGDPRIDKVVLTGSAATGRTVLSRLVDSVTPAVLELSGCDAVFVRRDADLQLTARALRFGMLLNGGFTCIAPRRVFVQRARLAELEQRLVDELRDAGPVEVGAGAAAQLRRLTVTAVASGARVVSGAIPSGPRMLPLVVADVAAEAPLADADLAAPVIALISVDDDEDALRMASRGRYELGASVFSADRAAARHLAERARAGVVVINDMIVPTADPRLPFGGRGASGYGVTRGAEGLLEMTRLKAVTERHGSFRPHLQPLGAREEKLLPLLVRTSHGRTLRRRLGAALGIVGTLFQPSRENRRRERR